jgi:hypothetical protein
MSRKNLNEPPILVGTPPGPLLENNLVKKEFRKIGSPGCSGVILASDIRAAGI